MRSRTQKRGRKPGICLTSRDLAILKSIEPGRVRTLTRVHEKYFPGRPRRSVWLRMKRLTNAGLLQESRGDRGCLLGWYLPRSGIRPPVYRTAFDHDETVRSVLEILEKAPIYRSSRLSHALASEMMRDAWKKSEGKRDEMRLGIPDALIHVEVLGEPAVIALEVELTRKTKARIEKKLEALLLNDRWDWVFFVVRGQPLMELIQRMNEWVEENSSRVKLARQINGIYFCELETLLSQGSDAIWESQTHSLKLKELKP